MKKRKKALAVRIRASVLVERSGKILLVYDPVYKGGVWILPGGGVEFEETLTEGAEREVYEETRIRVRVHSLVYIKELEEKATDYLELYGKLRKTYDFVLVADYIDGQVDSSKNPEKPEDGISRVKEARWVPRDELGEYLNPVPDYIRAYQPGKGPVAAIPLERIFKPKERQD